MLILRNYLVILRMEYSQMGIFSSPQDLSVRNALTQ